MPTDKDIIGLVKELQERHDAVPLGTDLLRDGKASATLLDLWHRFPSIAEALIKADTALLHLQNGWHGAFHSDDVMQFCKETRARIRSLS